MHDGILMHLKRVPSVLINLLFMFVIVK